MALVTVAGLVLSALGIRKVDDARIEALERLLQQEHRENRENIQALTASIDRLSENFARYLHENRYVGPKKPPYV